MHRRDIARLALDAVAQHDRRDVAREGGFRSRGKRPLRARDQLKARVREDRVAGFRRLVARLGEMCDDGFWFGDAVFREDGAGIGKGGRIGHGRARGDDSRVVAGHIRDRQCDDARRRRRGGEPPALDRREVFSDRVDLADRRARAQQGLRHPLLVGKPQPRCRQGQQRGAAARDKADELVFRSKPLRERQNVAGGLLPRRIGHGVARFDNADALAGDAMAMPGHDKAFERRRLFVGGPRLLEGPRHRRRGLARTHDDRAPRDRLRQIGQDCACRIGGGERCVKQNAQQVAGGIVPVRI